MPEYAALTIATFSGSFISALHSLTYCKVLVISCKNLELIDAAIIKADKVFQNIQESFLLEDAFKECVELGILFLT